jgi:hypothetical protein
VQARDPWPVVWLALALALLAAAAVIAFQGWVLARLRRATRDGFAAAAREGARLQAMRARRERASAGEDDAYGLLERAGYDVVGRQVPGAWTVRADGEPLTFGLRADYLVQRGGRRYVAEVKTGRLAPRLSHGPTRRQLLEYGSAFDVDGVVLVDADAERLTHVELERIGRSRAATARQVAAIVSVAIACFSVGVVVGAALAR